MSVVRIANRPVFSMAAVVVVACALAMLATHLVEPIRAVETTLMSRVQIATAAPSPAQDDRISVITIDEATMAQLPYRSPIDRDLLAIVVRSLTEAGAKAIGLDILFDQHTETSKDTNLMAALKAFPGKAVIAWADQRAGLTEKQSAWLSEFRQATGVTFGYANLVTDSDGVVRRHSRSLSGTDLESLAGALAGKNGPGDGGGNWLIDWRMPVPGGGSAFQMTPAHVVALLQKNKPILEKWFRDRIVIIGVDLPLQDRHPTPLSSFNDSSGTAGVLIHAHIIAQILDGRLAPSSPLWVRFIAVLAIALASYGVATTRWLVAIKAVALIALAGAYLAGGVAIAKAGLPSVPFVPALIGLLLCAIGAMGTDAVRAHRERQYIRNAFSHYLAPQLVEELVRNPKMLRLGGERREMSFLFTDIAGFTSMSEELQPDELSALLNEYLEGVSDIVMKHQGVIDKFIGDAVVGLFGVPGVEPAHAARAVECAIAIDQFAEAFRKDRVHLGLGETRIGVHTGTATVGNFGGKSRFDYTAIGDAMNTAARLEGANKAFRTRLAVSGDCLTSGEPFLAPNLPIQPIGDVILKGKQEPIHVVTIRRDISAEDLVEYRKAYDNLEKSPEIAYKYLRSIASDPVAALHLTRLEMGETGCRIVLQEK